MNQIHPDTHYRIQRSAQNARVQRSLQPKPERSTNSGQLPKGLVLIATLLTTIGGYIAFI